MRNFSLALLSLCGLIVAIPITDPPQSVDINNPSSSDPKTPPKQISFPKRPDNPFPNGIPIQPDKCDGEFPSDDCFHVMGGSGGYLYYESDSGCSDNQKNALETALWEATTLASYSSIFPNNGEGSRGSASAHFYMGPDYLSQKDRISGNLQRISEFKSGKTSEKAYITMSCKDTKNLCNERGQGTVGGYAWTYNGWFGYYHYITFCPPFFSLDNIDQKITEIESELSGGKTEKASDMRYLRTTGQYFLHEMMHTRIADGGKEPHITDEGVVEPGRTYPGNPAAYGPNLVHKLAQRPINQNGGAARASTNADSYAILANCAWWWDTTGYFPGVPGKYGPSSAEDDFPISLWIDLGNTSSPSEFDFASLFSADAEGFETSMTIILTTQPTTDMTATATVDTSRKDSYNFSPIPPEGHSTLPGTRQSPLSFSSSIPPAGSTSITSSLRLGTGPSSSVSAETSVGSATSSSTSATIKTSASVPDCLADGAPWYSPTSWCDCGPSSTYPALPATSGVTTANCEYTSLPASTIQPTSTSAAPTNIPGQGGIPACFAIASSKETSAYCNCGGTLAPTLNPTASGLINCAYTFLPTDSYNPEQTPPSATPPPSYTPRKCSVHIVQALGQEFSDAEVILAINITDANGTLIGSNKGRVDWGQTLNTDSLLPWVLLVTPQSGISSKRRSSGKLLRKRVGGPIHSNRPLFERGPVDFAYASQTWDTSSSQCSVGGWDNGDANDFFASLISSEDFFPNRQIGCLFDCPAPGNSEKRDMVEHHDEEWKMTR